MYVCVSVLVAFLFRFVLYVLCVRVRWLVGWCVFVLEWGACIYAGDFQWRRHLLCMSVCESADRRARLTDVIPA